MTHNTNRHAHSSYLPFFKNMTTFKKILRESAKEIRLLEKDGLNFDYLVCTGVSGIAIASPLSLRLNKGLIVIRKENDSSHSSHCVEGCPCSIPFNYLIIDDLISEGTTLRRIIGEINFTAYNRGNNVGIYLYNPSYSYSCHFYDRAKVEDICSKVVF